MTVTDREPAPLVAAVSAPRARERHIPALDGMRGIAVLLVLFFHFKLGPFRGGFVGVTMFFTLSGFLICSRTLGEIAGKGRFAVGQFFERRIRRLAPAAIACVVAVVVATAILGTYEQRASISGDALGALANVANWRFLLHGTSYTDLFAAPSPLNHFWSLAIEEQFYLVFPLVVWLALKLPGRLRAIAVALVVTAALAWATHVDATATTFDRFYYGTDSRMLELLVGVILALTLSYWRLSMPPLTGRRRLAFTALATAALLTIVVGATTYRNGGASFQSSGAILMAVATAVLILAALEGTNLVARGCSVRPLRWTGKVSYGAYLYHWPIVALSAKRWGTLHGTSLGLAQLGLSLALAGASYRYLEAPIQRRQFAATRGRLFRGWGRALVGAVALTLVLGLTYPAHGGSRYAPAGNALRIPAAAKVKPGVTVGKTSAADRPLRVLVTGDSTARVIANALVGYENAHPAKLQVLDLSLPGCPITPADLIRNYSGEQGQNVAWCSGWQKSFPHQIAAFKPDVSAVFLSVMEQTDQGAYTGGWHNLLDPTYRTHQEDEFRRLIDLLRATGAPVLWADAPYIKFQVDLPWLSDSPLRTDTLNAMYRQLASTTPKLRLLDYASHLNRPDHSVDTSIRPDGVHMTDAAAAKLAQTWLLPLLESYRPATSNSCGSASSLKCPSGHP